MMYYRLTQGLNSVGKLIPETDDVYKHIKNSRDYYVSIYKYNEDHKKHAEEMVDAEKVDKETGEVLEYKRPRGVTGIEDVKTDVVAFDLDNKSNMDQARLDTITTVERLLDMGVDIDNINVAFSGGKGFSVVVKHDKLITPQEHRTIAEGIAGDLDSWDTTLYNASRIFRVDGTKHNKTGLYKTPLDPDDLYGTMDDIMGMAKQKPTNIPKPKPIVLSEEFFKLQSRMPKKEKEKVEPTNIDVPHALNFSKKPHYLTDVKYALHQGYIPEGYGNEGMMVLCSTYKNVGFDMIDAYHMLKGVNEKRANIYGIPKRDNEEIYNQVVKFVYGPHWKGGMYSPKENDLLIKTCQEFGITDQSKLESFDNMMENFFDFAANINDNVIKTGIKSLDDSLLITTGMMVGVLGAPGAGKTSLVTSIVEESARNGMKPLFHSLDMHKHLMSMRLIQRQSGVSTETKLRKSIIGDPSYDPSYDIRSDSQIMDAVEQLSKIYQNVEFNFTRGATIESIEEDIKLNKAKNGDKFKLVVVDYLEKVRGPYSDATANSGYVASRLSDLASTYDVAIILLLQPQKSAGDPSEELLSMRKVKGASVIEQDCRVILTMWRPGFSPRADGSDKFATVAIVKNNMGSVKTLDYSWDGLKGDIEELTKEERSELKSLRDAIAAEKAAERSGNGWDL